MRNEPLEVQIAVASVILNRARQGGWWGNDVAKVCRKPKQFSCWNECDSNRAKMDGLELQDRAFACVVSVASGFSAGDVADTTGGAARRPGEQNESSARRSMIGWGGRILRRKRVVALNDRPDNG